MFGLRGITFLIGESGVSVLCEITFLIGESAVCVTLLTIRIMSQMTADMSRLSGSLSYRVMSYHRIFDTTGATSGTGISYLSEH